MPETRDKTTNLCWTATEYRDYEVATEAWNEAKGQTLKVGEYLRMCVNRGHSVVQAEVASNGKK